jgi:hypothetical protein
VTLGRAAHSIGTVLAGRSVPAWGSASPAIETAQSPRPMLTRRRAVDFCRVATALCQAAHGSSQPVAPRSGEAAS